MTVIIENSTVMPFRWHCNKYMCFFCGCPFAEASKLKDHHSKEHEDTKIRSTFRSLLRNSKVKLEITHVRCKNCYSNFANLDELLEHLTKVHSLEVNLESRAELFAFKLSDDKIACVDCGEDFQSFSTLLKHTHAFHNKAEAFLCEICGQAFVARANVLNHVKMVHSENVKCKTCNLQFRNLNSLQIHQRNVHKMYLLKCPFCPEVLDSPYLRNRHLAIVHDVKRYQFGCDLCSQVFPVKSRLVAHTKRVHLKERTFSCEVCGYMAFNRDSLSRHMVSHNDARPFQCEFCKKCFQRKKTLELHRRIHMDDKRYACKECEKAFVQVTSLKLHYRVHHSKNN